MNAFLLMLKLQTTHQQDLQMMAYLPQVRLQYGRNPMFSKKLLEEAFEIAAKMVTAFLSPGE